MDAINLATKFRTIDDYWKPRIVCEFNGQEVKLVKFRGQFIWHKHENSDEMFICQAGRFRIEFRDRMVELGPGDLFTVPRNVEHRTSAEEEAHVLVLEPVGTRNTGDVTHPEFTAEAIRV